MIVWQLAVMMWLIKWWFSIKSIQSQTQVVKFFRVHVLTMGLQALWDTRLVLAIMGRPRTKFLDMELQLPESQKERRLILNRLYNRNRPKVPKAKKDQARQGQVAAAPVADRSPEAPVVAALGECNCRREVHSLTNEMYQMQMRHKNVINQNAGLRNKISDLENSIKNLENEVKRLRKRDIWWRVSTSSFGDALVLAVSSRWQKRFCSLQSAFHCPWWC